MELVLFFAMLTSLSLLYIGNVNVVVVLLITSRSDGTAKVVFSDGTAAAAQKGKKKKKKTAEKVLTFDVEAASVLVPAFEPNLIAQDGEETFKLFTPALYKDVRAIGLLLLLLLMLCVYSKQNNPISSASIDFLFVYLFNCKVHFTIAKHLVVGTLSRFGVNHSKLKVYRSFLLFQ